MMHEVLVERIVLGDEDREGTVRPATGSSGLLPHRCPGSRIAREDAGVEGADVDPQLERGGRGDGEEIPVDQASLDPATVLREVPGPVGGDPVASGRVADLTARELGEQLRGPPRPREPDRADVRGDQFAHQPRGLRERAPPPPGLLVDDRGIPQREELPAGRTRVSFHHVHVETGEPLRQLAGVPDRRARQAPPRRAAVVIHQPPQSPEDHRDVRAEDASAHVRLIDHDERQAEEEVRPSCVIRQDRQVQHVRVREHEVRVPPDQRALRLGCVAVVGRGTDLRELQLPHGSELIARERLRREEVDGGRFGRGDRGFREGDVVHEGLPAGGAGREDRVVAGSERLEPGGLVRVEPLDPEQAEARDDDVGEIRGERLESRFPGWELTHAREALGRLRVGGQFLEESPCVHRLMTRGAERDALPRPA
jgi:hypothetical protein